MTRRWFDEVDEKFDHYREKWIWQSNPSDLWKPKSAHDPFSCNGNSRMFHKWHIFRTSLNPQHLTGLHSGAIA
jgi:hypothetical protein